jgi:hypothetical protein
MKLFVQTLTSAILINTVIHVGTAHAQPVTFSEKPVRITAIAKADKKAELTTITLSIQHEAQTFRFDVMQRGGANDALAQQKARTGWKGGYLFVRDDCLGGTAWRCMVDHIFTFLDPSEGNSGNEAGAKKRLVYLGDVMVADECIEEARVGCSLYENRFTDIYDALELNDLISHAESAAPMIEMRVKGAEFVIDLDETWARNQERFREGEKCLAAKPSETPEICVDGIQPASAYLFNAALAAYTRRIDQLARTKAFARIALCADQSEADCSQRLHKSATLLAKIKPGARPAPRAPVASNLSPK